MAKLKLNHLFFTIIVSIFCLAGCGGGSGGGGADTGEELEGNPLATKTETFGEDGNLYKPRSDDHASGAGNLVVLLSAKYNKQFEQCKIKKSSGEMASLHCINDQPWTHVPYSCFSNGGRQTWRANFQCDDVAEVKVICSDFNQEVTFTVPEAARRHICSRFG